MYWALGADDCVFQLWRWPRPAFVATTSRRIAKCFWNDKAIWGTTHDQGPCSIKCSSVERVPYRDPVSSTPVLDCVSISPSSIRHSEKTGVAWDKRSGRIIMTEIRHIPTCSPAVFSSGRTMALGPVTGMFSHAHIDAYTNKVVGYSRCSCLRRAIARGESTTVSDYTTGMLTISLRTASPLYGAWRAGGATWSQLWRN